MDKNVPKSTLVNECLALLEDEQTLQDSLVLIEMMQRISGCEPKIWNKATIGFGTYHYKYESGREGDCHVLGFYPRKDKLTLYLMDGTARYEDLLAKLGKRKTSKACLYVKRLADIDMVVLEQILQQSYDYIKSNDGNMHRAE